MQNNVSRRDTVYCSVEYFSGTSYSVIGQLRGAACYFVTETAGGPSFSSDPHATQGRRGREAGRRQQHPGAQSDQRHPGFLTGNDGSEPAAGRRGAV